uniref:Uncharacterized protein n=1 Tax=Trichuris muris TaxID=70415 RepID=A0A5S6Q836_TRIMR
MTHQMELYERSPKGVLLPSVASRNGQDGQNFMAIPFWCDASVASYLEEHNYFTTLTTFLNEIGFSSHSTELTDEVPDANISLWNNIEAKYNQLFLAENVRLRAQFESELKLLKQGMQSRIKDHLISLDREYETRRRQLETDLQTAKASLENQQIQLTWKQHSLERGLVEKARAIAAKESEMTSMAERERLDEQKAQIRAIRNDFISKVNEVLLNARIQERKRLAKRRNELLARETHLQRLIETFTCSTESEKLGILQKLLKDKDTYIKSLEGTFSVLKWRTKSSAKEEENQRLSAANALIYRKWMQDKVDLTRKINELKNKLRAEHMDFSKEMSMPAAADLAPVDSATQHNIGNSSPRSYAPLGTNVDNATLMDMQSLEETSAWHSPATDIPPGEVSPTWLKIIEKNAQKIEDYISVQGKIETEQRFANLSRNVEHLIKVIEQLNATEPAQEPEEQSKMEERGKFANPTPDGESTKVRDSEDSLWLQRLRHETAQQEKPLESSVYRPPNPPKSSEMAAPNYSNGSGSVRSNDYFEW